MKRIFYNTNGNAYYILFGGIGKKSLLCNLEKEQYVICSILEDDSWWQGNYFISFEDAYKKWKGEK